MQQLARPASTTYVRYSCSQSTALPRHAAGMLETAALYVVLSVFWGFVLYLAITQAL